jgi:hypothetical protein
VTPDPSVLLSASFETSTEGFVFQKDVFRNTVNSQLYAQGLIVSSLFGGALEVDLGGVDDTPATDLSGGWQTTFVMTEASHVRLAFRFQLIQSPDYNATDVSQALCSVDGNLYGQAPYDTVAQIVGNNGDSESVRTTGWKEIEIALGELEAGEHALIFGGYNNKKTGIGEITQILFDDVLVKLTEPPPDISAVITPVVRRLRVQRFTENIRLLAEFGDREQGSQSYSNAALWLRAELEAVGYVVQEHFYTYQEESRSNMYVTKVGRKFPDRMFMVTAHLDGRGGGGAADDDASGCSLVLEIARMLAAPDIATDISIRMIFWNNEETGLNGSEAYTADREALQGQESPPDSGIYPEPTWLGMIQHDMILFDHGLPPQDFFLFADADVEYSEGTVFADQSMQLANALLQGNTRYAQFYPAEVTSGMDYTDSVSFMQLTASVSISENQGTEEIFNGSNPHYHQTTDVFSTYDEEDFLFGFNILQATAGTVSQLAGLTIDEGINI